MSGWNATQLHVSDFNARPPMWKCPLELVEVSPRPTKNVPTRPVSGVSQCGFYMALLPHCEEENVDSTGSGSPARIPA